MRSTEGAPVSRSGANAAGSGAHGRPVAPPVVWSVAGTDSAGGAGLAADLRAADAFGVHLCPVVAAVTAQHSQAVTHIEPLSAAMLDAQLRTLAGDMPPRVIKTGLLGGVAQVRLVAQWVDRLRQAAPVALVVDPVLGASSGAAFADAPTLQAYRDELLPRATVITPNRREAARLLGQGASAQVSGADVPALARALRAAGAQAVCITGGDDDTAAPWVQDWFDGPHARGWLALPRVPTPHHHGTGCTFASGVAAALAMGFVSADAAVLAKMATTHALRRSHAAGAGAGPVVAGPGFGADASLLPQMSWGEAPLAPATTGRAPQRPAMGLYAIVDDACRVVPVLASGVRTLQLRIKAPPAPDAHWQARLRQAVEHSVAACRAAGALLFVNDHWRLAIAAGACGVHLGQEDLLALDDAQRAQLRASGLDLGVSSHSLWELCRAASLAPRYIACGPVWPTATKQMPWRAQGLHNLAWWRHMAPAPVVAIGGILDAERAAAAAGTGVDGVCVVRGLGADPAVSVPRFQQSIASASGLPPSAPAFPLPSLDPAAAQGVAARRSSRSGVG
ncbi:MAG: bifunctional hydroxymethylpyrimidine kinase/phosphomethylpyrimidine kinase [Rhodoferax sp.]|nr:bifunctional hydroxymethylpyrimidine kinase/phosphomethylpyrimidine kinase [Rhodoferax sp.]